MTVDDFIPLFDLDYDSREEEAVARVLRSRWLTMGEETKAFEEEFAAYIGVKHAVAVANGTAALHLANLAAGVGPGDEVICPSLTFVATANSVLYTGAKPVFADVTSLEDWTLSPTDVDSKITPRTKAVIVMHYAGFPCDMDAIRDVASRHGLKVIEDAAHAPGGEYKGSRLGALGDVACFSFFSNKNLATGEGGMLCTDSEACAEQMRLRRSHGMTSATLDRHRGQVFSYDVVRQGFNYRIDEIRSALGRVQLGKLDANNRRRERAAACYRRHLEGAVGLTIPFQERVCGTSRHIFPVLLDAEIDRERFMQRLWDAGIQTSIHYPPVHTLRYYRDLAAPSDLPLSEKIGRRTVTLPLYPGLTDEQTEWIATAVREALGE